MPSMPQRDRRAELAGADDTKVRSTRRRLAHALREAAADDAVRGASVGDIVARAGVSRSTFYTHFANVEELAVAAISDVFADLAPVDIDRRSRHELSRAEITRQGLGELLDALIEQRPLLLLAVNGAAAAAVREHFVDAMADTLTATIRVERPNASEAIINATAQYIAAGVLRLLLRSAMRDAVTNRDELLEIVFDLLPRYLTE